MTQQLSRLKSGISDLLESFVRICRYLENKLMSDGNEKDYVESMKACNDSIQRKVDYDKIIQFYESPSQQFLLNDGCTHFQKAINLVRIKKVLHDILIYIYDQKLNIKNLCEKLSVDRTGYYKRNRNLCPPMPQKPIRAVRASLVHYLKSTTDYTEQQLSVLTGYFNVDIMRYDVLEYILDDKLIDLRKYFTHKEIISYLRVDLLNNNEYE